MTSATDDDCDFCDIVAQDEHAREIFRTGLVVAFFPVEPATLGHTLLIPKIHVADIWTIDRELMAELGRWSVDLARIIRTVMRPDGLNIIQSNGEAATQTVKHFHIHVVPRWFQDRLGRIWPPETHFTEEQKDDAWEALREEFRREHHSPRNDHTNVARPTAKRAP